MKEFKIVPTIRMYPTVKEFLADTHPGKGDLLLTNRFLWENYFQGSTEEVRVLFYEDYASGEPSDEMVDAMYESLKGEQFSRVWGVGGGSVLDTAKILSLKGEESTAQLFATSAPLPKSRELLLVPTTCGTGSEMTNIAILEIRSLRTKKGLAWDSLYGNQAVLIPELVKGLPFPVFGTSSIDALVHGVESYLSPKASPLSRMYSRETIEKILKGYRRIREEGKQVLAETAGEFLLAAAYGGIAFGNAGCGPVHALSYPLGAVHHVPHGEANYAMFTEVLRVYEEKDPQGETLKELKTLLSELLETKEDVYTALEELLNGIVEKKPLAAYGVTDGELEDFTQAVMTQQGRLMANAYVPLDEKDMAGIYRRLWK